jgi:hypothetical protein
MYFAVYPEDAFYEKEFEKVAFVPYPESGKIIFKDASYPSVHGEYQSCALIEVSWEDYHRLMNQIHQPAANSGFPMGKVGSPSLNELIKQYGMLKMQSETERDEEREYFYCGFVVGKPWIVSHYCRN